MALPYSRVACVGVSALVSLLPQLVMANQGASSTAPVTMTQQQLAIFSQSLSFNLPANWKLAHSEQQQAMFSAEYLPQSQELQTWSSMLCIQGFKDLSEDISPQEFLNSMAGVYLESCQGDMVFEEVASDSINGHDTASAIIGCTKMPNSHVRDSNQSVFDAPVMLGEIGYYTAIRGKQDLYLLHKSLRGETFTKSTPPINNSNSSEFLSDITPLNVY